MQIHTETQETQAFASLKSITSRTLKHTDSHIHIHVQNTKPKPSRRRSSMVSVFGEEALMRRRMSAVGLQDDPCVMYDAQAKMQARLQYKVCMCVYIYVCMYVYMQARLQYNVCMCVYIYVCMYVYMHAFIHTHMLETGSPTNIYIYTYTYTYTCILIEKQALAKETINSQKDIMCICMRACMRRPTCIVVTGAPTSARKRALAMRNIL